MPKHLLEYDPHDPADVRKSIAFLQQFLPEEEPASAPAKRKTSAPRKAKAAPASASATPPVYPAKYVVSFSWKQAVRILRKNNLSLTMITRLKNSLFGYAADVGINLDEKKLFVGQLADKRLVKHVSAGSGKHYPHGLINYPNTGRKQVNAFNYLVRHFGVEPGSAPPRE